MLPLSPMMQTAAGVTSGLIVGKVTKKIGKAAVAILAGAIIVIPVAEHLGYLDIKGGMVRGEHSDFFVSSFLKLDPSMLPPLPNGAR